MITMLKEVRIYFVLIFFMMLAPATAQVIRGTVYAGGVKADAATLPGANVFWSGTGRGTITNAQGQFHLQRTKSDSLLVFSYIGYQPDTINISMHQGELRVELTPAVELEGVEITGSGASTHISRLDPIFTQNVTGAELQRAACCNLSESFETNASVDVHFSDAITGAKQIQLLGLAGVYVASMNENIPGLRGLAAAYGLGYVPGPWMESIQISKGASSVKNGFESTTGLINIEYKKPYGKELFFVNGFVNNTGKWDLNLNGAFDAGKKAETALFFHTEMSNASIDHNGDGFLDQPLLEQYNFYNRWELKLRENMHTEFGIRALKEDRKGGQDDAHGQENQVHDSIYRINIGTERIEAYFKNGIVFSRPATSLGIQAAYTWHDMDASLGFNKYEGRQSSLYANVIFESFISSTLHKFNTGVSLAYDRYRQSFNNMDMPVDEVVPGVFFEYSFIPSESFTLMAGLRADHHTEYGTFLTPRMHFKYSPTHHLTIRGSAGKGYRTAIILAENTQLMATSRQLVFEEEQRQEEAWNYGINATQYIDLLGKEMRVSLDYYRTDFINQIVIDQDEDPAYYYIYNLRGKSYSNSFQAEVAFEVFRNFDMTAAFRLNDVKTSTNGELQDKILVNRYKGLATASYKTAMRKWQFDFTAQFNGKSRLESTAHLPESYQRPDYSPAFTVLNFQVSRFYKTWSAYLGVENLTGFTQDDPVIAADEPFGPSFDASQVWGPIMGRMYYLGFRYCINKK
jgi:outer membrane receptor for ferrienterochelin and colicin